MPGSPGRDKRGRDTKVSLPLLTPQPFLRTRLPSVARLNARGPQGRLVLQEYTIDRSRAFRSGELPPCTVWPRTVMRGKSRKVNSGPNSVPKPARRPEPSSRNPRFAARPKGVAAQRRVLGESRGDRKPLVSCPLLSPPPDGGTPGRRRRPLTTPSEGVKSPPAAHRCIGGRSAVRRRYRDKKPLQLGRTAGADIVPRFEHTLLRREGKNRSSNRKQLMNLCPPLAYDATRFGRK